MYGCHTMMTMTMMAGVSEYQCLPLNHFPPVSVCVTSHIFIQGTVMNVLCFLETKNMMFHMLCRLFFNENHEEGGNDVLVKCQMLRKTFTTQIYCKC